MPVDNDSSLDDLPVEKKQKKKVRFKDPVVDQVQKPEVQQTNIDDGSSLDDLVVEPAEKKQKEEVEFPKAKKPKDEYQPVIDQAQELEAQQATFENIAFSGGGAKGVALAGALRQLEERGIGQNVKNVAGSSAGAMMATFYALGAEVDDLEQILRDNPVDTLANKSSLTKGVYLNKNTTAMQEMLANSINNVLEKNLDNIQQKYQEQLAQVREDMKEANLGKVELSRQAREDLINKSDQLEKFDIDKFAEKIRDKKPVTFGDIGALHAIDPQKYKNLMITTVDREKGELRVFNAKTDPNIDIATACRASCSLPLAFEPVEIEGKKYVDGGYLNNVPQDLFEKKDQQMGQVNSPEELQQAQQKGRTMAFVFGSNSDQKDPVNVALYHSREDITKHGKKFKFAVDIMYKLVNRTGGKFAYSEADEQTHRNIRNNSHNAVMLDTGEVDTLSFTKAKDKIELLYAKGDISTSRQLNNLGVEPEDLNLNQKEFAYEVLDAIFKDKKVNKAQRIADVNELVKFCKKEAWEGKTHQEGLEEFTKEILEKSPKYAKHIVENLNKKDTRQEIKYSYAEILDIDYDFEKVDDLNKHKFSRAELNEKFSFEPKESPDRSILDKITYPFKKAAGVVKSVINDYVIKPIKNIITTIDDKITEVIRNFEEGGAVNPNELNRTSEANQNHNVERENISQKETGNIKQENQSTSKDLQQVEATRATNLRIGERGARENVNSEQKIEPKITKQEITPKLARQATAVGSKLEDRMRKQDNNSVNVPQKKPVQSRGI